MLTQVEVFTPGITSPPWPIVDQGVSLDPVQIKEIRGLGPVASSVNTTPFGSIDGESLNGTHTPKRNIVITAALNPDWSIGQSYESLRQILYSYFMPKRQVRMRFTSTHLPPVEITGYVETFDLNMWSRDPEYQISLICPQPYFTAIDATVINDSTQSYSAGGVDFPVSNDGNVDTGFILNVLLPDGASPYSGEVRLINNTPTTKLAIVTGVTISSSQYFSISSLEGLKYVRRFPLPDGASTSIIGQLAAGSDWIILRPGMNNIQVLTATAGLDWAISYFARYGGL